MSKNILLVNPWIYDFAAYNLWIKPLGLYYLAAYLQKNGHTLNIIDCLDSFGGDDLPASSQPPSRLLIPPIREYRNGKFFYEELDKPAALRGINKKYKRYGMPLMFFQKRLETLEHIDFIFITSMMSYWYPAVWETIKIVRRVFPAAPLVLGGNYVTLCPEHAKGAGADFLITGAAEDGFEQIINSILCCNVEYLPNKTLPDTLPFPAFELAQRKDFLPILTARGCPFRCSYCASPIINTGFYRRSPENVLAEIKHWHNEHGTNNFAFYDDALLIKTDGLFAPLARAIIKEKIAANFHCPNGLHIAEITQKIANLLKSAHFRTIRFGLETSNERRQQETGGKVVNEQFIAAMRYLHEAGYEQKDIGVYILCGLPQQTVQEVEETIRFVWKKGGRPIIAEFSPIPGTKLWQEALSTSPYDLEGEPLYHNNSLLPCGGNDISLADLQKLKALTKT